MIDKDFIKKFNFRGLTFLAIIGFCLLGADKFSYVGCIYIMIAFMSCFVCNKKDEIKEETKNDT